MSKSVRPLNGRKGTLNLQETIRSADKKPYDNILDYRGDIGVILMNHGTEPFVVKQGDRIAQLVIAKHERVDWVEVEELSETNRGAGGFGHTGSI